MRRRSQRRAIARKSENSVDCDRFSQAQWIASAAFAVTPLALVPGVFLSHDVIPKFFLLSFAAVALLVSSSRWSAGVVDLWERTAGRWFLILVAAQTVSLVISTALSVQIPLSIGGTVWRRFGLIGQLAVLLIAVAIASLAVKRPSWIESLMRAVSVCGGIAAFYGILQYFGYDPFLDRRLYAIEYFGGVVRPPSTMGHALYFSAYLAPVVFIALASGLRESNLTWRRFHLLAAGLAAVAIVLSATRSATLAEIAGAVYFAWKLRARLPRARHVAIGVGVALLALAGFVASPAGANLRARARQWPSDFGGPRLAMWKEIPGLIAQHPLFGEGPDTFAGEFRKLESPELSRAYPDFVNETPHNIFFDAACAQGIPGMLILIAVFVFGWLHGGDDSLGSGLRAALLAILISSMFASFTLVEFLYLWTTVGLLVARESGVASEADIKSRFPRVVAFAAAAVFAVAGLALTAQDMDWARMNTAVAAGDAASAHEAWSGATSISLGLPSYELWASREWATLGRAQAGSQEPWKFAADAAARAEADGEERFSAAYQASVLAIAANDAARGESEARNAIALAPDWYRAHLLRSQILQFLGRNDEARREANLSLTLGAKRQ